MTLGHWDSDPFDNYKQNVMITEGIREVTFHTRIITTKNIILRHIITQDIITITTRTTQQILMVRRTEIKFPLETREIIMSLGET